MCYGGTSIGGVDTQLYVRQWDWFLPEHPMT